MRRLRFILGFTFLLLSFQNCNAPNSSPGQDANSSKDSKSTTGSSAMGSSSQTNSSGMNSGSARNITGAGSGTRSGGSSFGGISGGSAGGMGSSSGSSSSSGATGGTCLGCSSGGGSVGGGLLGGGGDFTFRITKQPDSKTIAEGTEFFVGISASGGKGPYSYKWYRNNEELPPMYGEAHFESYSDVLDRIYKEGDYHVVVTDSAGTKLTSNKAQIRMISKLCQRGNYFIDNSVRTNQNDPNYFFNDLFYYGTKKYFVSQYNPTATMFNFNGYAQYIGTIGLSYFTLGGDVSNNQNFSIACSTAVPTVHTPECATNSQNACQGYYDEDRYNVNRTYVGNINFLCRNGYLEFVSNTCNLVTATPLPREE